MTLEEANKVADILDEADGGCSHCADILRECAQECFPEFEWGSQFSEVTIKDQND